MGKMPAPPHPQLMSIVTDVFQLRGDYDSATHVFSCIHWRRSGRNPQANAIKNVKGSEG